MNIRTRFAPSPTGYLHIGGLRTALYNYLYAKKNNGQFILRIEDTDQNRLVEDATNRLIKIIQYFGIEYDEGPNLGGNYGPYIQSKRLDIYKKYLHQLIDEDKAYPCFFHIETPDKFEVEKDKKNLYDRMQNENYVVKFKIQDKTSLRVNDLIRGEISFDLSLIDDPIIFKSDGFPTYHFANVIDDHLMNITHVIRGEEWLPSLPKHVLLYKSFNWSPPLFSHLPLLLNPDKTKLSKRQGDVHAEDFLNKGYLKESIINFVAFLGWHPGGDSKQEIYNMEELINLFTIDRVHKSGCIFDIEKLNWMNSVYIKNTSKTYIQNKLENILSDNDIEVKDRLQLDKLIQFSINRINKLNDIVDEIQCFVKPNIFDIKLLNQYDTKILYNFWINELNKIDNFSKETIDLISSITKEKYNIYGKNLFIPLRLSLIGLEHGPDLFTIINILGIKESILRIKKIKELLDE